MTAISVVLPAKDEEHRIAATLERLVVAAPATGITEIIVVDDGSTDRTAAIVREFAQHPTPLVRLVQHERNRGKSASLRTGMQAAQGDLIALFDADLSVGPEHLSDAEAATLPCAAVTAWSALVTEGRLAAGETVLTLGTGGVSVFALQLAKLFGARVIITSSSDEKLARARELGADETLNYKTTAEWGKAAKDLTGGRGVDQVIEVGGAGTLQNSLRAVRPGGTVSVIGVLSGPTTDVNLLPVLMQNVRLQGVIVGHRESFEAMNRAISQAKLRPVVDKVFPLSDAKAAFEHMGRGDHFGKICIDLNAA